MNQKPAARQARLSTHAAPASLSLCRLSSRHGIYRPPPREIASIASIQTIFAGFSPDYRVAGGKCGAGGVKHLKNSSSPAGHNQRR
jgi:hypothetical protein